MNGKYLLDSNIIIDIFRGNENTVEKVQNLSPIIISAITIGELYYGANKSNQPAKRIAEIQELESSFEIAAIQSSTARIYGQLKNELRRIGKPIPENDIWIAAIAVEHDFHLLTKDKHFKSINSISLTLL